MGNLVNNGIAQVFKSVFMLSLCLEKLVISHSEDQEAMRQREREGDRGRERENKVENSCVCVCA